MIELKSNRKYDLEKRTFDFAEKVRNFIRKTPGNIRFTSDAKQLLRSSGSVAANYIEANDPLSRKDFFHRIRICRKEAKESRLWLRLIKVKIADLQKEKIELIQEALELTKIFGSIVQKAD